MIRTFLGAFAAILLVGCEKNDSEMTAYMSFISGGQGGDKFFEANPLPVVGRHAALSQVIAGGDVSSVVKAINESEPDIVMETKGQTQTSRTSAYIVNLAAKDQCTPTDFVVNSISVDGNVRLIIVRIGKDKLIELSAGKRPVGMSTLYVSCENQ